MLSYALVSLSLIALRQAPAGTQLHIRLNAPIATYSTKAGSSISAALIAPVVSATGEVILPAGSILNGTVRRAQRVGYGIAHETAALDLDFQSVELPDGRHFSIATRVSDVDNGRERVTDDGMIRGMRMTSSPAYRVSGYIRSSIALVLHARLEFWIAKMLILQVPEAEIFYPAGSELTLWLTQPFVSTRAETDRLAMSEEDRAELHDKLAGLPYRAYTPSNRPSDLMNIVLVGSREEIAAAFIAAGWTETKYSTWHAWVSGVRAVVQSQGYHAAPMSRLLVNNEDPGMSWQKGLNDMSKRHHIRLWKQSGDWNGKEIWAGAATRDVDFAYLRPGQAVTHRIEEDIDLERDKVARDLEFTNCAKAIDFWDRPGAPLSARNATGDPMTTDGRIGILQVSSCEAPRGIPSADPIRIHGNYFQRLARREILSVRSDFYRKNMYWRTYEGVRWSVAALHKRHAHTREFRPTEAVQDSLLARAKNSSWLR